eukprot:427786-Pleurochrysis_carterae.AAC.1
MCRNRLYFGGIQGAFSEFDGVLLLMHSPMLGMVTAYAKADRLKHLFVTDLEAEDVEKALGADHQ